MPSESWLSLAHKDKDIRTRRMVYLTQFSKPALLNPMINKMAGQSVRKIAFDEFAGGLGQCDL